MKTVQLIAALFLTAAAAPAPAAILFDRLPATSAGFNSTWASQVFDAFNSGYDINAIHGFTLGQATNLTEIDAALSGFNGFDATKYADVQVYSVNIYSSLSAGYTNLTGDVFSANIAPAAVTLTNTYNLSITRVASIPFAITLAAGSYFIGVTMRLDRSSGQIGVRSTLGPDYDFQVNPNGGFRFPGNRSLTDQLAYRLIGDAVPMPSPPIGGVPEPAAWALLIGGFGLIGGAARRRSMIPFVTA